MHKKRPLTVPGDVRYSVSGCSAELHNHGHGPPWLSRRACMHAVVCIPLRTPQIIDWAEQFEHLKLGARFPASHPMLSPMSAFITSLAVTATTDGSHRGSPCRARTALMQGTFFKSLASHLPWRQQRLQAGAYQTWMWERTRPGELDTSLQCIWQYSCPSFPQARGAQAINPRAESTNVHPSSDVSHAQGFLVAPSERAPLHQCRVTQKGRTCTLCSSLLTFSLPMFHAPNHE